MREIVDGIWDLEFDRAMPGGVTLPCRSTVVRLDDGGLAVISPIALTDDITQALRAHGRVRHVVAPNRYHHVYLSAWQAAYPDAAFWGAPGLPAKRPTVRFAGELDPAAPPPDFAGVLELAFVQGAPAMNEIVFFHPRTRTLIVTDLMFNVVGPMPWMSRLAFRAMGAWGRVAQSRSWRFVFVKQRAPFAASGAQILAWPFDRLISAHGAVVQSGAHAEAERALAWMVGGK